LADRVRHFITLNEVQVFISAGHYEGVHAPGDRLHFAEVLQAGHHALLAHGRGVQAIRSVAPQGCQVGFAPVGLAQMPESDKAEDVEAARAKTFSVGPQTGWTNSWWMDPVLLGKYPEEGLELYGAEAPEPRSGDLEVISEPVDFLGVNIYQGGRVRAGDDGRAVDVPHPVGHPISGFDWPITPEAMYWGPRFFHERYARPIIVTENGVSCRDWMSMDGEVHDPQRIDFIRRYLLELHRAIADGVPVKGYFHWSLLDNFEWAEGYKQRFGLVFVDYATQRRVLKDSAHFYRQVIESNGDDLLP
jgi:beta-glucosidase